MPENYFSPLFGDELRSKAAATGADGFIQKGINLFETVKTIKKLLEEG